MNFTAIVPARAASTRLPDKPLLDIAGKPMVVRTAEQALKSGALRVVIATDDTRILDAAQSHGVHAVLTRRDHPTGTDRLAEAVDILGLPDDAIIVNVQGDEPLIDPALVRSVAELLSRTPEAAIATCAARITQAETLFNPNAVKVVLNAAGLALFFSRAPIPWARNAYGQTRDNILEKAQQALDDGLPALHHIGLYAYRAEFLRRFPALPEGHLEKRESLEQLRALEHGHGIAVHIAGSHPAAGVDTREDLDRVRQVFANRL
ncbi:3-deoxy-manno-octulosonate cytidylyltransferase [Paracandidimonas soli]|uniref:3-deoxy-manno-octulosonate cytidylyltransferase n=1 Tax=Paracandidimonas soli TaxID=1917182 RepID=UPI003340B493